MTTEQPRIGQAQTDYDKAEALRIELSGLLRKVCSVMDHAREQGLILGFSITLNGNTGKYEFASPTVARHY